MHTETDITRVERFIRIYRSRITAALALVLMVVLNTAWVFTAAALHVSSTHLDMAVFGLSAMGSAIAALAFYWGAE